MESPYSSKVTYVQEGFRISELDSWVYEVIDSFMIPPPPTRGQGYLGLFPGLASLFPISVIIGATRVSL